MRGRDRLRLMIDRRAAQSVGRSPFGPRVTAAETWAADFEATISHLPVNPADIHMLQNPDGTFLFMLGFDDFGSGAVLG